MKKCPYCAEEIQDDAIKCKHCGEILNKSEENKEGFSEYFCFAYGSPLGKVLAKNTDEAKQEAFKKFKNIAHEQIFLLDRSELTIGRFSCPQCKSKYTKCVRDIGCLVLIMIFISLGIGLIMIPFLPYRCGCEECGYKWKS